MTLCQPCTDTGAAYVQEVVAPSGCTSSAGPPDGCDQSATKAKTRDQMVIAKPSWLTDSWDFVVFLTPYYVQQVVVVAFSTGVTSASEIQPFLRHTLNSIPTDVWWKKQLPIWHNPADYAIFDDLGNQVTPPTMAVGWHCPRLLQSLFDPTENNPRVLQLVREIRRWGRYMTVAPVANATEMKGRIASASLQFNSALNPIDSLDTVTIIGQPTPPSPSPLLGGIYETHPVQILYRDATTGWFWNGKRWRIIDMSRNFVNVPDEFGFTLYNQPITPLVVAIAANTPIVWNIFVQTGSWSTTATMSVSITVNQQATISFPTATLPFLNTARLMRNISAFSEQAVNLNELARYSITPDFSFEALLQADEKGYSNSFIEGAHSRQCWGKEHLDFTSTREYRPLIRAPRGGIVRQDLAAIKRDIVDLSGKWQITYATSLDANASFTLIYGTHMQMCCETDSEFMLFKRQVAPKDAGALEMASCLQAELPHTYPAKFNDGGILPMIMSRIKRVGTSGLQGVVRGVIGELFSTMQQVGTSDRLIGYPNNQVTYGNMPLSMFSYDNNGDGPRIKPAKTKRRGGFAARTMNLA